MPAPVASEPKFIICAEKDVLGGLLRAAPESRERDAILQILDRSGMVDSAVSFTPAQIEYLAAQSAELTGNPALGGSKYGLPMAGELFRNLVVRLQSAA